MLFIHKQGLPLRRLGIYSRSQESGVRSKALLFLVPRLCLGMLERRLCLHRPGTPPQEQSVFFLVPSFSDGTRDGATTGGLPLPRLGIYRVALSRCYSTEEVGFRSSTQPTTTILVPRLCLGTRKGQRATTRVGGATTLRTGVGWCVELGGRASTRAFPGRAWEREEVRSTKNDS